MFPLIDYETLKSLYLIMQEYVPLAENRSNLVQTAWAMMGLIHAGQVRLWFSFSYIMLSYAFLAYSDTKEVIALG